MIVMLATFGSKVLGLLESLVLASYYGIARANVVPAWGIAFVGVVLLTGVRRGFRAWPYEREYLKLVGAGLVGAVLLPKPALQLANGLPTVPDFALLFAAIPLTLGLTPSDRRFFGGLSG